MGKYKILCIDDEKNFLDSLRRTLMDFLAKTKYAEYSVEIAESATEALGIYKDCEKQGIEIPLVICDYLMPGMKGDELLIALHKANPKIKKILLTGQATLDGVRNTYEKANLYRYISKAWEDTDFQLTIKGALDQYSSDKNLEEIQKAKDVLLYDLIESRHAILESLGTALVKRDDTTGTHIVRIGEYCRCIAIAFGMDDKDADIIRNAAPMHDVGKIGIPDSILLKDGELTPDEVKKMNEHPIIGDKILARHPSLLLEQARLAAISHHEKWDGSGYPYGLSGEKIPLIGRIVAIADVFDARTSARPYKDANDMDEVIEGIIAESGKHFDPVLVEAFLKALPEIKRIRMQYNPLA